MGNKIPKKPKQRRRALSDVTRYITEIFCNNPDCVGEVGKFSRFYMDYIEASFDEPNPNVIKVWDEAILKQLKGKFNIQSITDLDETDYYKTITEKRQQWVNEAMEKGYDMWLTWAKAKIAEKQARKVKSSPNKLKL